MRHYARPLNAELLKYRKRKNISLYGEVAGPGGGRYLRGLHHVRPPGSRGPGFPPAQHHSIYDTGAFYEWPDQEYDQPESWFEQTFPPTPPLRVQKPPRHPRTPIPEYDDGLMTPDLFSQAMSAFVDAAMEQSELPQEPYGGMAEALRATNAEIAADVETAMPQETIPLEPQPSNREVFQGLENSVLDERVASLPNFADIADATGQLEEVFPPDHPDIVNLRAAAHEFLEHPELWPKPEDFGGIPGPSKLGVGDPYELDLYEEAGQAFAPDDTNQIGQEMFDQAMAQVAEPQMAPDPMAEDIDPIQDAYEQQFEQGLEAVVQEAMPEQDPFEMQHRMYDEEMEMLMNPFMRREQFGHDPMGP